jgi:hypothetical protein
MGQGQIADLIDKGIDPDQAMSMHKAVQPGFGTEAPSSVREWEYYNSLDPAQKSEYLRMKRAVPYLDLGDQFAQPDPANPGQIAGAPIPINNRQAAHDTALGGVEGRTAGERAIEAPMADVKTQMLNDRTDQVIKKVDEALGQSSFWTTGMIGGTTGGIPGMPSYDLRRTVDTIIANIGFAELQAMREASPTGGALGQVAVRELDMLQSVLASLDANQSEEQLRQNLAQIKELLERQKMYRQMAQDAKYGGAPAGAGAQTSTGVTWSYEP